MKAEILIVGGSGNIGSGLVDILAKQDIAVKLATRKPQECAARQGVAAVYFDYDDPASWEPALAGIERVFMIPKVGDPFPDQTVMPFIDRARQAGVERLVFSTAMGLDKDWRVLAVAEDHLIKSGINHTILRPGWFMQNFNPGYMLHAVRNGVITLPGSDDCQLSFIDTRDISAVAAAVLLNDGHFGKAYTLTGPRAYTWPQAAALLTQACGHPVKYENVTEKQARDGLLALGTSPYRVEQMLQMMRAMREGIYGEVSSSVRDVLGREPISLEQFAAENAHAWKT
ncbi:MAG: SDR family oxidoreductase [Porticoccaceae bacterium]